MKSREIHLRNRPVGMPEPDDFELVTVDVSDPADGEVTVRNLYMSVDPYMRGRMRDRESYVPPFQIGEVLSGGAVGKVVASEHPDFEPGDVVFSRKGWREAFTGPGEELRRLGEISAPPSAYLGVLGMPGRTAYVGLLEVGALEDGETVLVSGAAGAVGSVVGQIAKLKGCRVVGSAGSRKKIDWLTGELGFDHAFDYNEGRLREQIQEGAPEGVDVYYDNVGGDLLEAAISEMRQFGRIVLCGAISMYNATEPPPGPRNLPRAIGMGLTLRGFLVGHFPELAEDFRRDMESWVESGEVKYRETVFEGIERAPEAFIGLFTGANIGKMVVRLDGGDDEA